MPCAPLECEEIELASEGAVLCLNISDLHSPGSCHIAAPSTESGLFLSAEAGQRREW
jgi:hypothetical protein